MAWLSSMTVVYAEEIIMLSILQTALAITLSPQVFLYLILMICLEIIHYTLLMKIIFT